MTMNRHRDDFPSMIPTHLPSKANYNSLDSDKLQKNSNTHRIGVKEIQLQHRLNDTKTPIWQVKAHEQWVKTVLLSDVVAPKDKVCELYCDKGHDIGKWGRAKISYYLGVDPSVDFLSDARERWKQKNKPFEADFIQIDPSLESFCNIRWKNNLMFDVVCCFNGMQNCFQAESHVRILLANVSSCLRNGGYFIGILPDSSSIWYRVHKTIVERPCIRGALYSIEFKDDAFHFFGTTYRLKMEGSPEIEEYLVHFPSLVRIASEYQLVMIDITNLQDFYEENKKNYGDLLKTSGVLNKQGKIEPAQSDIIGLYTMFIFRKI